MVYIYIYGIYMVTGIFKKIKFVVVNIVYVQYISATKNKTIIFIYVISNYECEDVIKNTKDVTQNTSQIVRVKLRNVNSYYM